MCNVIYIIIAMELIHMFAHLLVLLGCKLVPSNRTVKRIYFILDLVSVIIAYLIVGNNIILVLIHLFIHLNAALYLFGMKSNFFDHVFEMAEQKWSRHSYFMKIAYVAGTLEDIITHGMSVYYGLKLFT